MTWRARSFLHGSWIVEVAPEEQVGAMSHQETDGVICRNVRRDVLLDATVVLDTIEASLPAEREASDESESQQAT